MILYRQANPCGSREEATSISFDPETTALENKAARTFARRRELGQMAPHRTATCASLVALAALAALATLASGEMARDREVADVSRLPTRTWMRTRPLPSRTSFSVQPLCFCPES